MAPRPFRLVTAPQKKEDTMTPITGYRGILSAAALALACTPALAQSDDGLMTTKELKAEISQAMDAVADYSEQERDQALTTAREAMTRLDAEIERREQALRENWSDMTEAAREEASERMADLREARNDLSERYGALKAGTSSAWDELKAGFAGAWDAFAGVWTDDEGSNSAN
jgi:DNA anti-recombination protein RmuC